MRLSIKKYLSLIKFSHTIFAMPFALIGFFLGLFFVHLNNERTFMPGQANDSVYIKLILVILCMVFARSAAMAFNRWLDAKYDALNPRTSKREIPSGIIKRNKALVFVILNSIAFIISTWFINNICFYLSFVALFIILFYSYTKRFTPLCHLILGLGLSLAPIGAFLAVTGHFKLLPLLFSLTVLFWVSGFDIIYALQDEEFDKENHLKSIPVLTGKKKALRISELLHLLSALSIIYAGFYGHFKVFYWLGVFVFLSLLAYQHTIVKPNNLSKVNIAFATTNGVASVLFCIFVLLDLYLNYQF